jgi:hypothetical protein
MLKIDKLSQDLSELVRKQYALRHMGFFLCVLLTVHLMVLWDQSVAETIEESVGSPLDTGIASSTWWSEVQQDLQEAEYNISEVNSAAASPRVLFQAPNRAHNLRILFGEEGIRIGPRVSIDADWSWGLSLQGIATEEGMLPVANSERIISGNRIEYRRGTLTEWYINNPSGLEQGFTLTEEPDTEATDIALVLEMNGDVQVKKLRDDGLEVSHSEIGVVLQFGKLMAYDADGKVLPSSCSVQDETLLIHVTTAKAVYPVVIDPVATTPVWEDKRATYYGASVADAGDVNGDGYNDIIVGAPRVAGVGNPDAGKAYVLLGSSTGFNSSVEFEIGGGRARFGQSVDGAGDVNGDGYDDIIIGAPYYSGEDGAAFIYYGSPTAFIGPTQIGSLGTDIRFGWSVAGAGDVNNDGYDDVIIGAPRAGNPPIIHNGKIYVFFGASPVLSGAAIEINGNGDSQFGYSVAGAGDINDDGYDDVIIGAPYASGGGEVAVFHGSPTDLVFSTQLLSENTNANFGWSVANAGDTNNDGYSDVIVGAINDNTAFVYYGSASGLSGSALSPTTLDINQSASGGFGSSVASAGDTNGDGYDDVIVGAPFYFNGDDARGTAYVFDGSANGISENPVQVENNIIIQSGFSTNTEFGSSVASAGDFNGDGFNDVIIGAPIRSIAFVYLGGVDSDNDGILDMIDSDDDNDGLPDDYEILNGLDSLSDDANQDKDADGLSNLEEFQYGTLANNSDSDGDGVSDFDEVENGRNPLVNEAAVIIIINSD